MSINNMSSGGIDLDEARFNRMNRNNQPEFAPGQEASFQNQDVFSTSPVQSPNTAMNDVFSTGVSNNPFGQSPFGATQPYGAMPTNVNPVFGGMPQQPQTQAQTVPKDDETKIWEATVAVGKMLKTGFLAVVEFFKDIVTSFSEYTPRGITGLGLRISILSVIIGSFGLVFTILGISFGVELLVSGLVSLIPGVLLMFCFTEGSRNCTSNYKQGNNTNQNFNTPSVEPLETVSSFATDGSAFGNSNNDWGSPSGFNYDESSDDDWGSSDSDSYDSDDYGDYEDEEEDWDSYQSVTPSDGMSVDEALNSLQEVPKGMYTREYLFEMFVKVLPTMYPDFAEIREVDEEDDAFEIWAERLREAAEVAGCKEDYLPELLELKENLFTIIVTCDRPQGFKPDAVATELANIYAYDDNTGAVNPDIFAKCTNVGNRCIITIFNGDSVMISLKDMMLHDSKFIKDTKNYLPIVLGINQMGEVIHADFKKIESIIISGMPRSGKSWFVQAVLNQMCAFISPRDLHIHIYDPKETISDFKAFRLPHAKCFVSKDNEIVNALRRIVKEEAPRRKKIIGDAGFVNIWDFKNRYPDVKLPIIYIVIDEVVTLAERMEKEVKQEFQGLLIELISQLPALGIRAFLIPHVIKHDIIAKTATDLVPCRISVRGDADHIEKATGSKPKEFPYKLVNQGDMAMRLTGFHNTLFVHGPVLTDSNEKNNDVMDYLRRVWSMLEPDEVKGSLAELAQEEEKVHELIKNLEDEPVDLGFGDNTYDDISSLLQD